MACTRRWSVSFWPLSHGEDPCVTSCRTVLLTHDACSFLIVPAVHFTSPYRGTQAFLLQPGYEACFRLYPIHMQLMCQESHAGWACGRRNDPGHNDRSIGHIGRKIHLAARRCQPGDDPDGDCYVKICLGRRKLGMALPLHGSRRGYRVSIIP